MNILSQYIKTTTALALVCTVGFSSFAGAGYPSDEEGEEIAASADAPKIERPFYPNDNESINEHMKQFINRSCHRWCKIDGNKDPALMGVWDIEDEIRVAKEHIKLLCMALHPLQAKQKESQERLESFRFIVSPEMEKPPAELKFRLRFRYPNDEKKIYENPMDYVRMRLEQLEKESERDNERVKEPLQMYNKLNDRLALLEKILKEDSEQL